MARKGKLTLVKMLGYRCPAKCQSWGILQSQLDHVLEVQQKAKQKKTKTQPTKASNNTERYSKLPCQEFDFVSSGLKWASMPYIVSGRWRERWWRGRERRHHPAWRSCLCCFVIPTTTRSQSASPFTSSMTPTRYANNVLSVPLFQRKCYKVFLQNVVWSHTFFFLPDCYISSCDIIHRGWLGSRHQLTN